MSVDRRNSANEARTEPPKRGGFARAANVWRNDTWVRPFFKRYWRVLVLAIFLGLVAAAFAGTLMFTSGYMISLAATLPFTVLAVHVPSLYVRIFGVGKPVLSYLERLASHDWVLRMTSELRRHLYRVIEEQPASARASRRMGEVLGLLAEDIEHIQNLYLRTVFPLIIAWLLYVLTIVLLGVFSPAAAAALALLLGMVVFVLPVVSLCVNGARLERAKALKAELYADLADNVLGIADWVYSGRNADYVQRFRGLQQELGEIDARVARFGRARDLLAQSFFGVSVVAVLAWAAAAFTPISPAAEGAAGALATFVPENAVVHAGNWIAAFSLCLFPLIESFSPASEAAMGFVTYGDSLDRMNQLSAFARGAGEGEGEGAAAAFAAAAGTAAGPDAAMGAAAAGSAVFASSAAEIVFENVSFAYPQSDRFVLNGMNLTIPAGQRVAVLGRSGAGKSTLISLLKGDYAPVAGSVRVAGMEASHAPEILTKRVGVIQQKPHLFNWTLRDNVALGRPSATDEEVERALAQVGLGELVARLPLGIRTVVDELGRRFSGGERHRIALARVLLANPSVVVLDEPFAGLDPVTEQALIDVIMRTLEGRTVIMVTHHLQGVSSCDRVVFVEDGAVAIDGAPDQLERESERYRKLLAFDRGF